MFLPLSQITALVMILVLPACSAQRRLFTIPTEILNMVEEPLPRSLKPVAYDLKLFPHLAENYFNGSVEIDVKCEEATNIIVLHARENLHIDSEWITVKHSGSSTSEPQIETFLHISNVTRNATSETLTVTLQETLQKSSSYQLHFDFNSTFNDSKYLGFFRGPSSENNNSGQSWYAGMLMMTNNARRVFPCFDEPSFKSIFKISVARLSGMSSFSVMPLESTELTENPEWVWDHFLPTPPLSAFSVNVVVSNGSSDDPVTVTSSLGNVTVQYHYKQLDTAEAVLNVTLLVPQLFKLVEEYLGVPYPVPKLDIVMEPTLGRGERTHSLGLILTGELYTSWVFEEKELFLQDFVFQFLNHMVTPEKWREFNVTNILGLQIATKALLRSINKEELSTYGLSELYERSCKPASYHERSEYPSDLSSQWFLRLVESVLTEGTFKRGLANFLTASKFSTFTEDMLWNALTHEGHADGFLLDSITVEDIKRSWLTKDRLCFPVVTVTRNYDENSAVLQQHQYNSDVSQNLTGEEQLWLIPVKYITPDALDPKALHVVAWLKEQKQISVSNLPDSHSFVIVNPIDEGFFIVNYDQHNWELIFQYLMTSRTNLPMDTRSKLLNDAYNLAFAGELNFDTALNMTLFLWNETDSLLFLSLMRLQARIDSLCQWTPVEDKLDIYFRRLLASKFESLSVPPKSEILEYGMYIEFKRTLCEFGYQSCVNGTNDKLILAGLPTFPLFDNDTKLVLFCLEFMRDNSSDLLSDVIKLLHAVSHQGYNAEKFLLKYLEKCPGYVNMIERILSAIVDGSLNMTVSESTCPFEEVLIGSSTSQNITFSFLVQHFDEIKERYGPYQREWRSFLKGVTSKIKTQEGLDRLLEFHTQFKDRLGGALKEVENAIEEVKRSLKWGRRNIPSIENWFDNVLPHFHSTA